MPNHIHGILILDKPADSESSAVETRFIACPPESKPKGGITGNHNPMLNENISKAIRWYKARCTFEIRKTGISDFAWQSRFYDRVIRNQNEYQKVADYIHENPLNWRQDKFYTERK